MSDSDSSSDPSSFGPEDAVPHEDLFEDDEMTGMENSKSDSFSYEVEGFAPNPAFSPGKMDENDDVFGATQTLSKADQTVVDQYRFMLQMGLPNDAVISKMMEASVKPYIMAAVLAPSYNNEKQDGSEDEEEIVEESYTDASASEDHSGEVADEADYDQEESEDYTENTEDHEEEEEEEVFSEEYSENEGGQEQSESQSSYEEEHVEGERSFANFEYGGPRSRDVPDDSSREQDPLMDLTETGMSISSGSTGYGDGGAFLRETKIEEDYDEEIVEEDSSSEEELSVLEDEIFRDEPPPRTRNDVEQPLPRKSQTAQAAAQTDDNTSTVKATVRRQFTILMILVMVMCFALITVVGVILAVALTNNDDNNNSNSSSDDRSNTPQPTGPTASPMPTTPGNSPASAPINMQPQQTLAGPVSSDFGASAVSSGNWVAIGMPLDTSGTGAVATYQRPILANIGSDSDDSFQLIETLEGSSDGSRYGASLDFSSPVANNPYLIVGAPLAPIANTNVAVGAAYFYAYSRKDLQWTLQGSRITGGSGAASNGQAFGTSVATSDAYRVVVGAPLYGGNYVGRVYTFGFGQILGTTNFDWQPLSEDTPLVGAQSNALFGTSIDLTPDGNTLVVGAPGMSRLQTFEWDDTNSVWTSSFVLSRSDAVDMGSQVKFLSSNYIAVGAPSATNSRGLAMVFQRQDSNTWKQVGPDIVGTVGQRLGSALSGQEGPNGPELVTATAKGEILRFDLISGAWLERFNVDVGSSLYSITSVDVVDPGITSAGATAVVVGLASADTAIVLQQTAGPPNPTSFTQSPKETTLLYGANSAVDFGSSVAWAGDMLAVCMPKYESTGAVQPFQWSSSAEDFIKTDLVVDTSGSSNPFGSAVDVGIATDRTVRMGVAVTSTQNIGAAFYFEYSDGIWDQIGGIISDDAPVEVGGQYGPTVAIASTIRRVAVGIPSGGSSSRGRISTYDYIGSAWQEVGPGPLTGPTGSYMGASMDISSDGNRLVVGSPGGSGNVQCFNWAPGLWFQIATITGIAGEALGSSVAFINPEGSRFVMGAPNFFSKRGAVRVYGQSTPNGAFTVVGNPILGNPGEMIGTTVCGKNGRIAFGTNTGSFRVYDFDGTRWIELKSGAATNTAVVSIAMSDDGNSIAVGYVDEEVRTFDLTGL